MDNKVPFKLPLRVDEFEGLFKIADATGGWLFQLPEQQARYLVQAANLHGELLNALREVVDATQPDGVRNCPYCAGEHDTHYPDCGWNKARAVLGKVGV